MFRTKRFYLFAGLIIFLSGCSQQKNTLINRGYHNLTSHYNGYFNSRERMKDGELKIWEAHEDKFDRVLSVFRHADAAKGKSAASLMDQCIQKSSLVIKRHSMLIKGKEYCKWIDENYMLIGKAKYFKRDYYEAIETFQYVVAQYPKEPTKYEALAWLVITYLQTGNQLEAESIVEYLKNDKKVPGNLQGFVSAACAYFYITMKNNAFAIEQLNKAVANSHQKKYRARYTFILAQLYQAEGNNPLAYALYGKVIKMDPSYELTFNAKINRARVFDSDSKNSEQVKNELLKMLKDAKNKEYFDQIYYALAGIAMREGDIPLAITYLEKSARASVKNPNQKALSYMELAKIYFKRPDYRKAQMYYDSSAVLISKDHPDYDAVQNRKTVLTKLIKNLNTIAYEDSMQKLAKLSPKELERVVDKMIKAALDEEDRKKKEEAEQKGSGSTVGTTATINSGTQWYFYNSASISFGITEFAKKWGTRKLEDHWRRSTKQSNDENVETTESDSTDVKDSVSSDIKDRQKYTKNIPVNDKQLEQSNIKILEALYGNAGIYREQLFDKKETAASLEEMLVRYPENKYKLPAYYQLYRTYAELGNTERSDYYKNLLLDKYPTSEYSKVIRNPKYLKEMQSDKQKLNKFYAETYNAFMNSQYETVFRNKNIADTLYPDNNLAPKFSMLKALSIGKTRPLSEFETALHDIIRDYPKDSVQFRAQEILGYISAQRTTILESEQKRQSEKRDTSVAELKKEISFGASLDTLSYYVVTFRMGSLNNELLKEKLIKFNKNNFDTLGLKADVVQLDDHNLMVRVSALRNKKAAKDYFLSVSQNEVVFEDFKGAIFNDFVITAGNYNLLLEEKNVEKYVNFFKVNYLK